MTLHDVEDVAQYTKSGLMARAGTEADAPFVLLSSFPTGEVQLAHRDGKGLDASAPPTAKGMLPDLRLRLVRKGGTFTASYRENGAWRAFATVPDVLPRSVIVGPIACSNDPSQLVKVAYRDLRLTP